MTTKEILEEIVNELNWKKREIDNYHDSLEDKRRYIIARATSMTQSQTYYETICLIKSKIETLRQ